MTRKLLVAVVAGGALCAIAPAAASADAASSLNMTTSFGHIAATRTHLTGAKTTLSPLAQPGKMAVETNSGYRCATTVGVGPKDNREANFHVTDSSQFTVSARDAATETVVSQCVGTLSPGTTVSSSIVSHAVKCLQFDPADSTQTILGTGISTTYPDRTYSESCNSPGQPTAVDTASVLTPSAAVAPATSTTPTIVKTGYSCSSTVATGRTGAVPEMVKTTDATEYAFQFTRNGKTLLSIVANCVGELPTGAKAPKTPVSVRAVCNRITSPADPSRRLTGYGTVTTYPDGMYSKTCTTRRSLTK